MNHFKITRRKLLFSLSAAGCCAATLGYGKLIESQWLATDSVTCRIKGKPLPEPVRILHMSDLHVSKAVPLSFIDEAVRLGLSLEPDIICLTGDYVTGRGFDMTRYAAVLKKLSDAAPTFGVVGNHDGGEWLALHRGGFPDCKQIFKLLDKSGIECLHNRSTSVTIKGRPLTLAGLGDISTRNIYPRRAFEKVHDDGETPIVLLAHNPDSKFILKPHDFDLMLCGHTHGGQIAVPFLGPPFSGVADRNFIHGLNAWDGRWIYITRGVGSISGIRFSCRPEVSLVSLV
jgi:uncharacterized protein